MALTPETAPFEVSTICGESTLVLPAEAEFPTAFEYARAAGIRRFDASSLTRLSTLDFVLRYADQIEGLSVGANPDLDLGPLYELGSLRSLYVDRKRNPPNLARLPGLLQYSGSWHRDLRLDEAPSLRALSLPNFAHDSLEAMLWPPSLVVLELSNGRMASTRGIERAPKSLRRLSMSMLRRLAEVTVPEDHSLRQLWLYTCGHANYLSGPRRLRSLRLNACAPIPSLRFVQGLERLEDLGFVRTKVTDGDLGPLLDHPSLRWVGFMDSRALSHTNRELDRALRARGGYAVWQVEDEPSPYAPAPLTADIPE